jgi:hypothetical protein
VIFVRYGALARISRFCRRLMSPRPAGDFSPYLKSAWQRMLNRFGG